MIQNPVLTPQQQPNPDSTDPSRYIIRAVQGHSIRTISAEKLLTPILASDPDCPTLVVHGTYENFWHEISKSGGLKPMSRTHIHFAAREPEKVPPLEVVLGGKKGRDEGGDLGEGRVLSGMRVGATVLIWVDLRRTLEGGVRWWRSENGVFLTDGVEGGVGEKEEGKGEKRERMLGLEWIRWVEKRGPKGGVLWKNEGVDVEGEKFANRMGGLSVGGKQRSGDGSDGQEKAAENGAGREGQEGDGKTGGGTSVKESWDD